MKLYIGLLVLGLVIVGGGVWFLFNPITWKGKPVAPPAYTGPTISDELQSDWHKTTISKVESLIGHSLPIPAYIPSGYEINEVYYQEGANSKPPVTNVLLLISDQDVEWTGRTFTSRLALLIGWNHAGLGLKMPWARYIPEVHGRLEEKEGEYALWWETYGSPQSLGSTLILRASQQFPVDEMIKIAVSTPPE